jgi:hypothetical protein
MHAVIAVMYWGLMEAFDPVFMADETTCARAHARCIL